MIGSVCHTDQRAEPQAARVGINASKRGTLKGVDIDHHLGPHDVELHQINERRAPGKKLDLLVPFRSPGGR
jgi:hypothetical protein